jgi:hypothetical protein
MDCAVCVYYSGESQCKLHGRLKALDAWISCDDFIDASQKLVAGSCCGIYNFPTLSRPGAKPEKEK